MMSDIDREKIVADLKAVIEDVEELIKATADQTGEQITELRHRLQRRLHDARAALAEQQQLWCEQVMDKGSAAAQCLRENPWTPFAIAIGVGLFLGLLLRRD